MLLQKPTACFCRTFQHRTAQARARNASWMSAASRSEHASSETHWAMRHQGNAGVGTNVTPSLESRAEATKWLDSEATRRKPRRGYDGRLGGQRSWDATFTGGTFLTNCLRPPASASLAPESNRHGN